MRGFTLVEVMVSLAVGGMVVAAAYALLGAAADTRRRLERERAEVLPAAAARATLRQWLAGAALWEGAGPFAGRDRREGTMPVDEVTFAVADGGALRPGPRRVRLWVERNALAGRRGLLAEVADLRPGRGERTDTLSLAPEAAGMETRFRAVENGRGTWVHAWESSARLPDAVEITVRPWPQHAASGDGLGGMARVWAIPLAVPLRTDLNAERQDAADGTAGVRAGGGAVGAGAGLGGGG